MTKRFTLFVLAALLLGGAVRAEVVFTDFPPARPDLSWYEADYLDNYDADTIDFDIHLGFKVLLHDERIRLYGVDAWEMRGDEAPLGKKAKKFATRLLKKAEAILLHSIKEEGGKYGRPIVEVFILTDTKPEFTDRGGTWHPAEEHWINLSVAEVEAGHAEIVDYD